MIKNYFNFYSIKEFQNQNILLGGGSFAKVKLMKNILNKKLYALKEININNIDDYDWGLIKKEIELHKQLNHRNIIKLEGYFKDENYFYIVLQYALNGDLFNFINKNLFLDDKIIIKIFKQVIKAIRYVHNKNILHRDLKPENILLDENDNVKVCDFGWCTEYDDNIKRETFCGTYEYMAPEILFKKNQTKKTDIWSLGILLYELIHKRAPFKGKTINEVKERIKQNIITFKKNINQDAKNLVLSILKVDPNERPSLEEILNSKYLKKKSIIKKKEINNFPFKNKNINKYQNIVKNEKLFKYKENKPKIIKTTIRKYNNPEQILKKDNFNYKEFIKKLEKENYKFIEYKLIKYK